MVKIAQTLVEGASEYERKSQRIDFAGLSGKHEVSAADPSIAHIYGPSPIPAAVVSTISIPFVANAPVEKKRFALRKAPQPAVIITPAEVPEAVEEKWFATVALRCIDSKTP